MPLSYFSRKKQIDNHLRNQAYTPPANIYISLLTTFPTDMGGTGLVELTGSAYARQVMALDAATDPGQTANTSLIAYPQATSDYAAPIVGYGWHDALTVGNFLGANKLEVTISAEPITLVAGIAALANADVSQVVVKNNAESVTYTEGTDYFVQYDRGVICRNPAGAIGATDALKVTYQKPTTRTILQDDQFTFPIGAVKFGYKAFT
jgi:hypothetical protein